MKRKTVTAILGILCAALFLASCHAFPSEQVEILEGDDRIEARLDTSSGYSIASTDPFSIEKDGHAVIYGVVTSADSYDQIRKDVVENQELGEERDEWDSVMEILEESERDGNQYMLYSVNSQNVTEYDCVVKVAGTDSSVILGCMDSADMVRDAFEAMTFSAAA